MTVNMSLCAVPRGVSYVAKVQLEWDELGTVFENSGKKDTVKNRI